MIANPMSWIHDIEQLVPSGSLTKGRNYFRDGAVQIGAASMDRVEAIVKGGGRYDVVIFLDLEEQAVVGSCTCPHYDNLNICKHIWAALLAAESKGHLQRITEMDDPYLETQIEYDENSGDGEFGEPDEFGEDGEDDESPRYHPGPSRHDARRPVQRAAKPPQMAELDAWKAHLASLRTATPGQSLARNPEKRRIVYVADVARSLSAGGLVLQAAACRLKKNEEWGKPGFQERSIQNVSQLEPADQGILALLSGSKDVYSYYPSQPTDSSRTLHRLTPAAQDLLIPMVCETGRFFVRPSATPETLLPVQWDAGPPWCFKIEVERNDRGGEYIIKGLLVRDDVQIPLAEPLLLVAGLAFFGDRVTRFDDAGAFRWVAMLRSAGNIKVPLGQRSAFLDEITRLSVVPPMELPDELRVENRALEHPPELKVRPLQESWRIQQKLCANVTFNYDGVKVAQTDEAAIVHDTASGRLFRRDRDAETAHLNRLGELGFQPTGSWQQHRWELSPSRLPAAVRALVSEGWRVDAEGKLYRRAGSFQMSVASGVDWFELHGHADFEGRPVQMPQILKAIARGERTVRLGDGSYGLLPEDWLKRYRLVATLGKSSDGQMRFERHQAGLLDALLAEQPEVTFDEGFARVRREMTTFAGVQAAEGAATFKGHLREYQREGLGWLHFLRRFAFGGCLADDMGLGKTVQVLALLDSVERSRPALIVVPRSLIFNWKQEAARFTPRLRILDHTGLDRMDSWTDIESHDVILTTYGTLRRDAPRLKDIHFDTVVLDEAQSIKNANTESAKAARLLKADPRLALTGTPVENRLGDLWSLFEFLNPGLLGTASVFRTEIAPQKKGSGGPPADSTAGSLGILAKALRPFLLRRTKQQVARELPPKTEQTIYCELEAEQRRVYDGLRAHYRDALLGRIDEVGIDKSRMQILEALLRLRQAACHPGLIDKERTDQSSAKLDSLIPQIAQLIAEGHKALVFSQFTSFLAILRDRLDREQISYEYLDGRTRDRQARVQRFQDDGACRLFLISLKAGGLGLNLTAAEYVFLLDPWWNPAVESQAIDRTHRIGQRRNVFAYRLIARDTVEEKILDLQKSKRELADAIITADNGILASLSRENLELLLS